jgi:uncharacterized Rmd1/YagE family protein
MLGSGSPATQLADLHSRLLEADSLERSSSSIQGPQSAVHAKYLSAMENSPLRRAQPSVGIEGLAALPALPPSAVPASGLKQKRRRNVVTNRPVMTRPERVGPSTGTVHAIALGESIDIAYVESQWQDHRQDAATDLYPLFEKFVESVVSIEKQVSYWKIGSEGLDCFVFAFGSIVCWDCSEEQLETLRTRVMNLVGKALKEPKKDKVVYTSALARMEQEAVMGGALTGGGSDGESNAPRLKPKIVYGNIQMTSVNLFEKLAYSYALAQSVRLDVFEADIEDAISATSQIPVHLAKAGSVGLSNRAVTIKMGELFLQRSNVNLHSDILDTPELFWEFDEYEQMYVLGRSYLDIDKRITILNQRLDIMKDLYEMLQNELNVKHSAKIEIIIIVLILAEIVLQVLGMVISWLTGVQVFER